MKAYSFPDSLGYRRNCGMMYVDTRIPAVAPEPEKVEADEVFAWVVGALKSGTSIDVIRHEVEAAHSLFLRIKGGLCG